MSVKHHLKLTCLCYNSFQYFLSTALFVQGIVSEPWLRGVTLTYFLYFRSFHFHKIGVSFVANVTMKIIIISEVQNKFWVGGGGGGGGTNHLTMAIYISN